MMLAKSMNRIGKDLGNCVFTDSEGNADGRAKERDYDPGKLVKVPGRTLGGGRIPRRKPAVKQRRLG